jgi:hypothetical protein
LSFKKDKTEKTNSRKSWLTSDSFCVRQIWCRCDLHRSPTPMHRTDKLNGSSSWLLKVLSLTTPIIHYGGISYRKFPAYLLSFGQLRNNTAWHSVTNHS